MKEQSEIAKDVVLLAERLGWRRTETKLASTGSVYVELVRKRHKLKEWVVIRIADHKKVYNRWLTTYSISRYEYNIDEIMDILGQSFGEVGDIL